MAITVHTFIFSCLEMTVASIVDGLIVQGSLYYILIIHAVLRVKQIHTNTTDEKFNMSLIEDEDAEIHIPREVISGHGADEQVRVASFLYRNMSGLLPERLGRIEDFMRKKE